MKFAALLALCGPFVLPSFAQDTRPIDSGTRPIDSGVASYGSPTCTLGLVYCGQTLLNKGWPAELVIGISDGFPRGYQNFVDNFRRALFKCGSSKYRYNEATPGLTYLGMCDNVCVDGGVGKSDYCATHGEIVKCTPGLKYCGMTLKFMGYTISQINKDLSTASARPRPYPSANYIGEFEGSLFQCRPDGLWYETECAYPNSYCVDAGPGKSDYCQYV